MEKKKRMICFISEQPLANYIPLNETATRPDFLYVLYSNKTKSVWDNLRPMAQALKVQIGDVQPFEEVFDANGVRLRCQEFMQDAPEDEWSLNFTGGTKVMAAAAVDLFKQQKRPMYYVDSNENQTLKFTVSADEWKMEALPFAGKIALKDYLALHGKKDILPSANPLDPNEQGLFDVLYKLQWDLAGSVKLRIDLNEGDDGDDDGGDTENTQTGKMDEAEFDFIALKHYQMSLAETKAHKLLSPPEPTSYADPEKFKRDLKAHNREKKRQAKEVERDLFKLYAAKQRFGGPYCKLYFIPGSGNELGPAIQARCEDYGITLIQAHKIPSLQANPEQFGFPAYDPAKQKAQTANE